MSHRHGLANRRVGLFFVLLSVVALALGDVRPAAAQCPPLEVAESVGSGGGDHHGFAVALDGDLAVIGAPSADLPGKSNAGVAHLFCLAEGVWEGCGTLIAPDAEAEDWFGYAVAVSGEWVVVGAPCDGFWGYTGAGSAYVHQRSRDGWSHVKLTADDASSYDGFGFSVATDGQTIVIGANSEDRPGYPNAGSVYVFTRSGTTWSQSAHLIADDGHAEDHFGQSVAVSGDILLVGASQEDLTAGANAGVTYVFERVGASWVQTAKLTASDAEEYEYFGYSVAVDGPTAVVGAFFADAGDVDEAGAAYVFERSAGGWTQSAKLTAPEPEQWDDFACSVGISAARVIVGARFDHDADGAWLGSVHVFARAPAGWTYAATLTASDGVADDQFGYAVAISCGRAVVGAPLRTMPAGAAYVFNLDCSFHGDLNCDGLADFGDINAFVLALSNPDAHDATYPNCSRKTADCNCDDNVDFADINPFVALLAGS